ncbi:MAG: TRAP transporter large permease subunit [Bacillota bacterium]
METAGLGMLAAVAVLLVATGLPAWIVLIGVAIAFSIAGVLAGAIAWQLLGAVPARLLGLLESDILQALPLYVLMGALLNHLPLAQILFRVGSRMLAFTGAGASLSGLGLGAILAPMNGSVGASVAMLSRTVQPRLDASGVPAERSAALVCMASTLGVVVPPSLVLILLGDTMLRAHTEAVNATGESVRIINTQDIFVGALVPAALSLVLAAAITWRMNYRGARAQRAESPPTPKEWAIAIATAASIASLLGGVTLGYLYAVEAAATGALALFLFGVLTRTLTFATLREVLRDTMAITGALFALLVAATVFTLVIRTFGTDRWLGTVLADVSRTSGNAWIPLALVLGIIGACALVLDAFEMIFVVIPIVMPPLLAVVHDATWVAVLTLLILQASFLTPPFGYSVLMVRASLKRPLANDALMKALIPYLVAQLLALALVIALPELIVRKS